jgi:DNA adenine methylase
MLSWVGGKSAHVPRILAALPPVVHTYHEPFLGGGSVLEAVLRSGRVQGNVYASDANPKLIALFRAVKDDVDTLISELTDLRRNTTSAAFYKARDRFNAAPTAALFLYLNKLGFRGLYRENRAGNFNVPFGNYSKPRVFDTGKLRELSELYRRYDVRFSCQPWQAALCNAMGDGQACVYLDPPYVKLSATTFVAYTAGGFSAAEGKALQDAMQGAQALVVYSNHDTPEVLAALQGWTIERFSARRSIHSKDPSKCTMELLAVNR